MSRLVDMNSSTSHINWYELAFLGVIFIGTTFSFLLIFTQKVNRIANRFLALAVVVMVLWIARLLISDIRIGTYDLYREYLPLQFSLALGPLLYFYVLKLTRPDNKLGWKNLLHFGPVLLQQVILIAAVKLNPILQILAFISVAAYLYLSYQLIKRFYQELEFIHGDRYRNELRWLHRLLTVFGLVWLLWIPVTVSDYYFFQYKLAITAYYPLYLALAVLMIWIAAAAYLRPEVNVTTETPTSSRPLPPAELRQKGTWLKKTIKENRYYEDPELNLRSLAEKLNVHPNELSRIINTSLKKSFNDFINEYRVAEVVWKMQDPTYDHITLQGIAYESGFNSKTTFHRSFKEMTGKSPAEYKANQKNELPSYNLEPRARFAPVISYRETTPKWTQTKSNRKIMFKNHFKIAWRNLMRNKGYATINITGLGIGIAACLLIFLVVQFETSFDTFHSKKDSIYRVVTAENGPNGLGLGSGVPFPTSEALRIDYPQLKGVAAILRYGGQYTVGDPNSKQAVKKFKEDDAYYCEPQFFNIFDFGWLAGDKKTALSEPKTVVLTQDEADRFFGDWHNAIGKVIRFENKTDFKVTGVLKNFPDNTDFPVKIMMSYASMRQKDGQFNGNMNDWVSIFGSHYVFVVLPSSLAPAQFNKDLAAFVKKHKPADYAKQGMQLQPLSDMHYNTKVHIFGTHKPFSKELINAISLIGMFLLLIACVNFINLATAQAVNRSKEVGIRKVLGSNRKQLVLQFLSETFIITLFAVGIAVVIAAVVIMPLNQLLDIKLTDAMLYQPIVVAFIGATIISVTVLSGFYPAIVLSGFNPITALKNKIAGSKTSGISLRRSLVVLQFCIAQVLVIGTLVIIYQMNYFRNQSLGFEKDAIMNVPFPNDSVNLLKLPALRNWFLQQPGVKDVSYSFTSPSDNGGWSTDFKYNNSPKKTDFQASLKWADADYFKLYKLQFVAGQAYKKSDTITGYVVNEALLNKLGVHNPKDALGKNINLWDDKTKTARIVGVVKDFNVSSLKDAIPPVLMSSWQPVYQTINIKIQPVGFSSTLASVEKIWNSTFPEAIYEYQFLDDKIANFYKSDDQLAMLYKIFAGIAIFISCLGLYGLVSFMAVQRTKEVGIRKTLGASVGNIVYLFSKEFTLLIIVAFLISAPIGYYFMYKWLQDFTYKINIGPEIFVLAIIVSVAIAWLTVGYKAVKAALANPVNSLRSE